MLRCMSWVARGLYQCSVNAVVQKCWFIIERVFGLTSSAITRRSLASRRRLLWLSSSITARKRRRVPFYKSPSPVRTLSKGRPVRLPSRVHRQEPSLLEQAIKWLNLDFTQPRLIETRATRLLEFRILNYVNLRLRIALGGDIPIDSPA